MIEGPEGSSSKGPPIDSIIDGEILLSRDQDCTEDNQFGRGGIYKL